MSYVDLPVTFDCGGELLLGVLSRPLQPARTGVLLVVGGPQYRVGSHRQFVLLARALAAGGFAAMRFDYRGMGDSGGATRGFEDVGGDVGAAIDAFQAACPEVGSIVLWGLCDAASAALLYWLQCRDARVGGLCLLNPWVRSETTLARTRVKHYYRQRLMQREFWAKVLSGRMDVLGSLSGLLRNARLSAGHAADGDEPTSFQEKMALALAQFPERVLLILSGQDYTAREFVEYAGTSRTLALALRRDNLSRHEIPAADHTFSSAAWRDEVAAVTLGWLRQLDGAA